MTRLHFGMVAALLIGAAGGVYISESISKIQSPGAVQTVSVHQTSSLSHSSKPTPSASLASASLPAPASSPTPQPPSTPSSPSLPHDAQKLAKQIADDLGDVDTKNLEIGKVISLLSARLNQSLPAMLDKETRLDRTIAGPGKRFTYVFTVVNYRKKDVNLSVFQQRMKDQITANYRTRPEMQELRKNNVELRYQYKDKLGEVIYDMTVAPKDF